MSEAGGGTGDLSVGEAVRLGLSMMPGGDGVGVSMAALWNNTNFIVDGRASAPGKGGGFELDVDTAEGLYREAKALAYDLQEQAMAARRLATLILLLRTRPVWVSTMSNPALRLELSMSMQSGSFIRDLRWRWARLWACIRSRTSRPDVISPSPVGRTIPAEVMSDGARERGGGCRSGGVGRCWVFGGCGRGCGADV